MSSLILVLKNLGRNPMRTILTMLGTMVLVSAAIMIWSVLLFLERVTTDAGQGVKVIVHERWSVSGRMPFAYAESLSTGAATGPDDVRPLESMTWQVYAGTLDALKPTRDNTIFAIALEAEKIPTMLEGVEGLPRSDAETVSECARQLVAARDGMILGLDRQRALGARVGDRIKLHGISECRGIDLEFQVVGVFPVNFYESFAIYNRDYLNDAIEQFERTHWGRSHPLKTRSMDLVWLRMSDMESFHRVAAQIESSPIYRDPPVRCETASSGLALYLDPYSDLIWGLRWLLMPTCLATLSLVFANALGISARERSTELAVLKVLGYSPGRILLLLLGEAGLLALVAAFSSALLTYVIVNWGFGGLRFPVSAFTAFLIPVGSLAWGTGLGVITALAGSLLPARAACRAKAANVFSRVS